MAAPLSVSLKAARASGTARETCCADVRQPSEPVEVLHLAGNLYGQIAGIQAGTRSTPLFRRGWRGRMHHCRCRSDRPRRFP